MTRLPKPAVVAAAALLGLCLSPLPSVDAAATAESAASATASSAGGGGSGSLSMKGLLQKSDIPSTGEDWMSLSPDGLEFQPNRNLHSLDDEQKAAALEEARQQFLSGGRRNLSNRNGSGRNLDGGDSDRGDDSDRYTHYTKQFVNGDETYYAPYSQFWRLLGLYIDCNSPEEEQSDCDYADGDENGNSGSGDSIPPCGRYLLWAAYIDMDYGGEGIMEYSFFDRHSNSWSTDSCQAESGRCQRVDCHLKDTNMQLLGFFKEPNYHSWMEQLFKHEGVCIWTYDEYYFMQQDRELWPCGCTKTSTKDDETGEYLYYDTKPMPEGSISLGLYTDDRCSLDYKGNQDVAEVLSEFVRSGEYEGGDNDYGTTVDRLGKELEEWNDAFDIFKVCQPCMAYNLNYDTNPYPANQNQNGGGGGNDNNNNNGRKFDCNDDAGYTNVNQCMKFMDKTFMLTADFRDLKLASDQGTAVQFEVMGYTYGKGGYGSNFVSRQTGNMLSPYTWDGVRKISKGSIIFFVVSLCVMLVAAITFCLIKRKAKRQQSSMETPLVPGVYGVAA